MKKLPLIGMLVLLVMIVVAVVTAGRMGDTSHAYARGRVILDDSLQDAAKGIRTLFIVVASPDMPMPLGVQRTTLKADASGVVYEFVLTKDSMQRMGMGDVPLPETFKLKARLDKYGQGGADQSGDLTGEVYPVKLGAEDVEIRINHLVP